MKKIFGFIIAQFIIILFCNAQSISPTESAEFCPLTSVTFTVTIPRIETGTTPTVSSWTNSPSLVGGVNNISHTPTQTTFTFVGQFRDINIVQSFKIDYTPAGGVQSSYYPSFKRIKSLFYPNPIGLTGSSPCQVFRANQTSITAPICQVSNSTVSVISTNWSTYGEGNDFCWGSISTCEYQLPNGWSIGNSVSNGSNWILGGASVTVTSDQTTGNASYIRIRPTNSCATGLNNGTIPAQVYISRPEPPLSISGATQICFPNSYNYTISGVPSGGVVTWSSSSYYSVSSNGNTATITPNSTANGGTNVTASVFLPSCGLTFTKSFPISVGVSTATFNIVSYPYEEPNCYEAFGIYSFQAQLATGYSNSYSDLEWGWRNITNNTSSSSISNGIYYTFVPYEAGVYEIWVKPTNACGVGMYESLKTVTVNETCFSGFRTQGTLLKIYPNPTRGQFKVMVPSEFRQTGIVQISNQFGMMVLTHKVPKGAATVDIDISKFGQGTYQVVLKSGKKLLQANLIKQ